VIPDEICYVQIVTAHRGGIFTAGQTMRFGSYRSAVEECESLQRDFDTDAEPRRVYVLDAGKIPIWAGAARGIAPGYALTQPRERHRRERSVSLDRRP
jgi:hypothetical protein